ncbi:hypothetical protein ABEF93_004636 [Exophiala dermatitidis]
MSGPDFIELSSPYGSGPFSIDRPFHRRQRSKSISSPRRKSASVHYNPILTPRDDDGNAGSASHSPVDGYPRTIDLGSRRLGKYGVELWLEVVLCGFAVFAVVPFIWLAVAMVNFHHKEVTESRTNYIKQSTSAISTLFTILFAAVFGSTLKRFATWRLERGIRVGLLEQIMQSRTVFGAVTTQFSLRTINLATVVLLAIWTFSPLGSQASLRLISTGTLYTTQSSPGHYVDTISNQVFVGISSVDSLLTALKPTYISSLLGPETMKNGATDFWDNVRIPWLLDDAEEDADGWIPLSNADLNETSYSSLLGIPVQPLANRNSSFSLETTYMKLDCDKPKNEPLVDINFNVTSGNGTFLGPNTTAPDHNYLYPDWQVAMDQFVDNQIYYYGWPELLVNVSDNNLPQATFLFQTRGPWVARCKINQIYVESNVSCESTDSSVPACSVVAQRESREKHAPSTVTTLSFPMTFWLVSHEWIMATDPMRSSGFSTLTEYYLQNTSTAFIISGNDRYYANYTNVTAEEFSHRLGQLLNTWVLASQVSADAMAYDLVHRNMTEIYTDSRPVYLCSWPWLSVYLASIGVMFVAALFSIWCETHTAIPDVLSYCSSVTRQSKFFDFVKGGSALGGGARARRLRELEVKMGEVVEEDDGTQFRNDFVSELNPKADERRGYLAIATPEYLRPPKRGAFYS